MNTLDHKDTTLTPLSLIGAIGDFDYDPCGVASHRTAKMINEWPSDGLTFPWLGRVWLNPPYSNPKPWLAKLAEHGDGVALVLASVETGWFQDLIFSRASGIKFLRGRPKFTRLDFSRVSLMRPVVLVAYGEDCSELLKRSPLPGKFVRLQPC